MSYSIAVTESVLHGICVCVYNEWHINAGGATRDLAPRATAEVAATAGAERPEVLPSGVAVDLPATLISVASPGDGHGLGQGHLSWNSG